MTIDLALVSLQTLFLSLYGLLEIALPKAGKTRKWIPFSLTCLAVILLCIGLPDELSSSIQLLLFVLLGLNYLISVMGTSLGLLRLVLQSLVVALSIGLLYLQIGHWAVWLALPLLIGGSIALSGHYHNQIQTASAYFLRAGSLLTLLFLLEPLFLSIQQNLKPIPTIPIASIINQHSLLLLGLLAVLVLGGFIWKEKSRP